MVDEEAVHVFDRDVTSTEVLLVCDGNISEIFWNKINSKNITA